MHYLRFHNNLLLRPGEIIADSSGLGSGGHLTDLSICGQFRDYESAAAGISAGIAGCRCGNINFPAGFKGFLDGLDFRGDIFEVELFGGQDRFIDDHVGHPAEVELGICAVIENDGYCPIGAGIDTVIEKYRAVWLQHSNDAVS